MSKRNYVCFDCRTAIRRTPSNGEKKLCPECGEPCHNIGYKIPVPRNSKFREWSALKDDFFASRRRAEEKQSKAAVQRKHYIEKRLIELQERAPNKGRDYEIRRFRKELESLGV